MRTVQKEASCTASRRQLPERESLATTTETQSAQVSCMLRAPSVFLGTLPVRISYSDREITGVALLDGGAQTSIATGDVFNKLKVKCPPSILRITTVTGQVRKYNSLLADITIKSSDGVKSFKMEKVRLIPELHISRDYGPTKEDIKKFDHLRDVPFASIDQPVCLLIGADTRKRFFILKSVEKIADSQLLSRRHLGGLFKGQAGKGRQTV